MTANGRTAIGKMMDCILRDVALWEREHCETPERIFVSPRLYAMLKYGYSRVLPTHDGNTGAELEYYLAGVGRRFTSLEEDLQCG